MNAENEKSTLVSFFFGCHLRQKQGLDVSFFKNFAPAGSGGSANFTFFSAAEKDQ